MRIANIVTRQVETCAADETAASLASRMLSAHVGNLVVIEHRNGESVPIGIVTDRDLVIAVMAPKLDANSVTAGQIMSHGLVVVCESDDVSIALDEMRRSGVRRLPVVDDSGKLTGIVALDDVMAYLASLLVDVSRIGQVQPIEEQRART
jgi:CBS domain-containing protein